MRRTFVLLGLAVAAASPARAQSYQGSFGLDAMVAPTTSFGFAYYVTDGLSVRPWLGLGYSDYNGFFANLGAQLRFEPAPAGAFSPYLSGIAQYSHYGNSGQTMVVAPGSGAYQPLGYQSDLGQFGAGVGVRYRVSGSLALFTEGRVMYATAPMGAYGTGWSSVSVNDRTHVDAVLGLTYLFH
ncbi:MAG TPA: hypothetical protein VL691_09795 [Vicinamibacteria bacterium]|nr:hypothetical protein [Vicinamibacteria bacterium]